MCQGYSAVTGSRDNYLELGETDLRRQYRQMNGTKYTEKDAVFKYVTLRGPP